MKYVCTVCGHEVDAEEFEKLPEDWTCPLCGMGKDSFKKVEE